MQIGHWMSPQWHLPVNLIWCQCNRRAPRWTREEESQIQKTLLAKRHVFWSRISSTALTLSLMSGYWYSWRSLKLIITVEISLNTKSHFAVHCPWVNRGFFPPLLKNKEAANPALFVQTLLSGEFKWQSFHTDPGSSLLSSSWWNDMRKVHPRGSDKTAKWLVPSGDTGILAGGCIIAA